MNYVVFDTETTSLNKPFAYNIGYVILDEDGAFLLEKDFVVEQVWHNLPLFSTAYYAEKRPIYVASMRARKTTMKKFGYICQEMARDFAKYDVVCAYAYNSNFDEKVFDFNCDWFKCINPFDNIPIYDIRGNVHNFLIDEDFFQFCEENGEFTDSGNYSTTAETLYRYLISDTEWAEDHTALSDSLIEAEILLATISLGAHFNKSYPTKRSIERKAEKTLHIQTAEQTDYYFNYEKIRVNKDKTEIILKQRAHLPFIFLNRVRRLTSNKNFLKIIFDFLIIICYH